uniref:DUF4781 domain-containing protein n=1 Tax=Plectus sambesii TaxID=2011161 RepID=A0A914V0R5_9BILA
MAKSGEILCTSGRVAVTLLGGASLSVNGIGIVHGAANLYERARNNQLTPLDVFQFTASVLFFTNSIVSIKTASGIIEDVQRNVLNKFEEHVNNLPHEQQAPYRELLTAAPDAKDGRIIHENARIIKGISIIEVKGNFDKPSNTLASVVDKVVHESDHPTISKSQAPVPLKGDENHAPLDGLASSTLLKKTVELSDRNGHIQEAKESLLAAGDLLSTKADQALQFNEIYPMTVPDTRSVPSTASSAGAKTILSAQKPTPSSDQPKAVKKSAGAPKSADKTAHIANNFSRYLTPEERLHEEYLQRKEKEGENENID